MLVRALGKLGELFMSWSFQLGGLLVLTARILANAAPWRLDRPETWRALYRIGVKSFPIVMVTALLTGAIMVIQSGTYIQEYGAYGLLGWGAGYSVLREVGPVMIGLMFSGRVGANNAAELGTMKVTEQIDALRALAIDPIAYLVVPRFYGMIVMMFVLTLIGDAAALIGGGITCQYLLGVDMKLYFWSIATYINLADLWIGLFKSLFFGYAIAVISCHYGLTTTGGAQGVGRSVNNAVVGAAIAIFGLDYILTYMSL